MPTQAPVRIKPGTGTLIVDLSRNEIAALDLAAFLNALHGEVVTFHPGMEYPAAGAWQEMVSTALRKALSHDHRPSA